MIVRTTALYAATALAELVGCYLPMLWLQGRRPVWVLLPAAGALALFTYLLSLHPAASGRVYAAYGGVYVAASILWLWQVDGISPTAWDLAGAAVACLGMAIIVLQPR